MAEVRYTKSHEWCRLEDGVATCGITGHAVEELNDLTFLDVRVAPGDAIARGDVFGEIDSVKATSELIAPLSGTVEAVNERFQQEEELPAINRDPLGEGWMIKIRASDPDELAEHMDEAAYKAFCASS